MKPHLLETLGNLADQDCQLLAPWKWCKELPLDDLKLLQQENMEFVLEATAEVLEHDYEGPSFGCFRILHRENKVKEELKLVSKLEMFETDWAKVEKSSYQILHLSSPSSKSTARHPAISVSLGRLVKIRGVAPDKGKRLTTTYVVLLNLTTNAISIWLMYDYHTPPHDANPFTHLNTPEDYAHPDSYLSGQEALKIPRIES